MGPTDPTGKNWSQLLDAVGRRRDLACLIDRTVRWLWIVSAGFGVLLLTQRLLGLGPDVFAVWTPLLLPVVALVLAALGRRTDRKTAARLLDRHAGTRDLFLTRECLADAHGEYQPLVERDAEQRARGLTAVAAIPIRVGREWRTAAIAIVLVWLGVLLLPELDPFGRGGAKQDTAQAAEALSEHKKIATKRAAELRKKKVAEPQSPEVAASMQELEKVLREMKRTQAQENRNRLIKQQQQLGSEWRAARKKGLGRSAKRGRQTFGTRNSSEQQRWKQELAAGKSGSLTKEVQSLRELSKQAGDAEKRQELEKRLEKLRQFSNREASSPELRQALSRALQQLRMMDQEAISSDALSALDETLALTELEMEALAQSMRDMESLEKALEMLQLAKALNELDPLDGEACSECQSMGDYAALYSKLMAQCEGDGECGHCQGQGCSACNGTGRSPGNGTGSTGGQGFGRGGLSPEDPTAVTDFTPQRSRSALRAGRMLMKWKNSEVADSGQAELDYAEVVRQVQQGASEAILKENVPPSYHKAIQGYFDQMGTRKPR